MKRIMATLMAAAGVAVAAGAVHADPGGFAPPPPSQGGGSIGPSVGGEFSDPNTFLGRNAGQPPRSPDRYGLLPGLRRVFKIGGGCSTCGEVVSGPAYGGPMAGGYGPGMGGPAVQQGTLVFPHHTYVRSPRDFFMYEPGR